VPGCGTITDVQNGFSSGYSAVNRAMNAASNNFCANISGGAFPLLFGCLPPSTSNSACSPSGAAINGTSGFGASTGGNLTWKTARYFKNANIDPEELKDKYGYSSDGDLAVESGTGRVVDLAGSRANTPTMHDQFDCHWFVVRLPVVGAPRKPTWDIETWRPDIGVVGFIENSCN
jgi:hypothetical protein